jgi:hypothetical protein
MRVLAEFDPSGRRHGKHLLNKWALDMRDEAVRWGMPNDSRHHR